MDSPSKHPDHDEHKQDKTVADSFPASDPPANSGIVGPGEPRTKPQENRRGQDPNQKK